MAHAHLIGIGGSGLSAIAALLLEKGEVVSGSDRQVTPASQALQSMGARVVIGHNSDNIIGADYVVRSSAIPDTNPEVQAAQAAGIPVFKRDRFLGELLKGERVIAVAGTHGKTTTTAMIAWILSAIGRDPSYIIGGYSINLAGNAHAGKSDYFVIEADEYDRMFLGLTPYLAVVTNLEYDHPDCYPTPDSFHQAFVDFVARLAPGGTLIACTDNPGAKQLLIQAGDNGVSIRSYGLSSTPAGKKPDYYASDLVPNALGGFTFLFSVDDRFIHGDRDSVSVSLKVPGRHNVLNAVAALGVAHRLGLPLEASAQALGEFLGTHRRFEVRGEVNGILVIDDYAHHPSEIKATLGTARERYPQRKIWAVWQPHTFSRVLALFNDFVSAFDDVDVVIVTEVYAAREVPPEDGFSAERLVEAMSLREAYFIPELWQATDFLLSGLRPGDVLLVLSAGDADQISQSVLDQMAAGHTV